MLYYPCTNVRIGSPYAANPLDAFLPITRALVRATLGQPTPPQQQGWPAIQRGEHTLILAPTGSGTLSAFDRPALP
jgi:ATP-dependent Lhr-like helicase